MDYFLKYWNSYSSEQEAKDASKAMWSDASLSKGIVKSAIECLVSFFTQSNAVTKDISLIAEGLWGGNYTLSFNNLRITVLAAEQTEHAISNMLNEVKDRHRESLCICLLPSSNYSIWPFDQENKQTSIASVIPLYPVDIDYIANNKLQLYDIVEYKLYCRIIQEKGDLETQFFRNVFKKFKDIRDISYSEANIIEFDKVLKKLPDNYGDWIEHPSVAQVTKALISGRGCFLFGPSSSGKTILATQVGKYLYLGGHRINYVNFRNVLGFPSGILELFLNNQMDKKCSVLIADDLQSNPSAARYILAVASAAQRICISLPPILLGISWTEFAKDIVSWYDSCLPLAIRPHQIRSELISQYNSVLSSEDLTKLSEKLGEDLFLLHLSLEQSKERGYCVELREVAKKVWESKTEKIKIKYDEVVRATLISGSLGRYDIPTPLKFLIREANITEKTVKKLVKSGFFRQQGTNVTIGHRSLCGLITDWLSMQSEWEKNEKYYIPNNATMVFLDYLGSVGSSLAIDTLRALKIRAGFKKRSLLNRRAATVVEIWRAFNSVVERIEQQQLIDPTWGNDPASATFAIETFTNIGKPELAQPSLDFLRKHWKVENDQLVVLADGLSTQEDFAQIRDKMKDEDEIYAEKHKPLYWASANEIDDESFHKTWLMGLILCAESFAKKPVEPLSRLTSLVENQQLGNGAFYPARVPWSTARVLLGLAACGCTYDTCVSIQKAVNWLLCDEGDGGARINGIWQSGTGVWNSDLETTSMVLLALSAVGYDFSEELLAPVKAFLLSTKAQWTLSGKELDGVVAIQAFLDIGGNWEEVASEAQLLSQWAHSEAFWKGARLTAIETLDQSCKVAQIATFLISIGWTAIRTNIPAFLDALDVPVTYKYEICKTEDVLLKDQKTKDRISVDVHEEYPYLSNIQKIKQLSQTEYTVVGDYLRYDERTRNQLHDKYLQIIKPFSTPTLARENFLIWAAPGSGKTFFIKEIADSISDKITFFELNLALQSKTKFMSMLNEVKKTKKPTLCLIDEIDAKAEEIWPYEECFSLLDLNLDKKLNIVFVLIGSSQTGIEGMIRNIKTRNKGKDLMDRIPDDRRFEIPSLRIEDRILVFTGGILRAAEELDITASAVEKLAIYYVINNTSITTPRQLRDLAYTACSRLPKDENRLKYDDLFFRGDNRNQQFWAKNQEIAHSLSNTFIRVIR